MVGKVQGLLIISSFISLSLYIPFTIMTLFYTYKVLLNSPKTIAIKALLVFFIVMLAYGFELLLFNDALGQKRTSFLIAVIGSIGPVFAFYYFTLQGVISKQKLCVFFVFFLSVAILEFYTYQAKALIMMSRGLGEITNNSSYVVLGLFPFVFLMNKRPMIQYLTLGVLSFYVILGLKRGAILILAILILWFFMSTIKSSSFTKRFYLILLFVTLLFIGVNFIDKFYNESEYFQYRVEATQEGSSSSRDKIYSTLWSHYKSNTNLIQVVFGEGAYHTENVTNGLKAHNDWLELLIDCGFFGAFIYIIYWIAFLSDLRKSRFHPVTYAILGSCFLYTFLRTLFSMSFTDTPFYLSLMIGYGFALLHSPQPLDK